MTSFRTGLSKGLLERHIANFGPYRICIETIFPPSYRILRLTDSDPERFADVLGYATEYLPQLDWYYHSPGICVSAFLRHKLVGAGWGTVICSIDGSIGCNLTSALGAECEGQGLATVLTATACAMTIRVRRQITFVNFQTERRNVPARRLATTLGLKRAAKFDRPGDAPLAERFYVTYRASAPRVSQRCLELLDAMQHPSGMR